MTTTIYPKSFFIIRHGQSTDNVEDLISGCGSDPELTDKGRVQARASSAVFAVLKRALGPVIVSCREDGKTFYRRTQQTAELLTSMKPEAFVPEAGIRERAFGMQDGKMTEKEYRRAGVALEGEELPPQHQERVVEALNRRLKEATKPPLFVAHGGTTRRILEAMGVAKGRVEVENGQIYQMVPMKDTWMIFELSVEHGKLKRTDITPKAIMGRTVPGY